jgi:hypothetical protein
MMYPKGFPYQRFTIADFDNISSEKQRGGVITIKGMIPGGDVVVADFKVSHSFPRRDWVAFRVSFIESDTHQAIEALSKLYEVNA